MHKKTIFFGVIFTILITAVVCVMEFTYEEKIVPINLYQVYLDGNKLGVITDQDALYDLINKEQKEIKSEYNVDRVYPPNGFEIMQYQTYEEKITDVESIYNSIKSAKPFTVKGYTITIKSKNDEKNDKVINVLDKDIFTKAINSFVNAFIGSDTLNAYINDTQLEIVDTGSILESVYFEENITIKEAYLSTNEKIFTDEDELSQYLLFSTTEPEQTYQVAVGDTISSVSFDHKLNVEEFLVANPTFSSENSILSIGQIVNVSLIKPMLNLSYEKHVVKDVEFAYDTETKYDSSKYSSYKVVTQEGSNGINRVTSKVKYTNGEQSQGEYIVSYTTIKDAINEIVVKGNKSYSYTSGTYVDTGATWAWPTNSPYVITSPYAYRWGKLHAGVDISGTGMGSPIYAALGGTVAFAGTGDSCGWSCGKYIVINHNNGYYTIYMHLSAINVSTGQSVSRKQVIGKMGSTGESTGTHLHFGLFSGMPYKGGSPINPLSLWR